MAEDRMLNDEILLGLIKANGGGGGGTNNYENLNNLPKINSVELKGNKSLSDLGIASAQSVSNITNGESINNFAGVETTLATKQNATDNSLETDAKTIVGAINEHEGDIDSLKSGLTDLTDHVDGDAVTYPYADVITVSDAVPANLADCSVKVEPIQDLHGYDKPWVGGAGKNKLPLVLADIKTANTDGTWSGDTYTLNGVSFTVLKDADGNVTGVKTGNNQTATGGNASFNIVTLSQGVTLDNGQYIGNGCPANGSTSTYYLRFTGGFDASSDIGEGTGVKTVTTSAISVYIRVTEGATVSNLIFAPMIRLATETDSTFAPYTNICPISGHTEASVQRDGKNLCGELEQGGFDASGLNDTSTQRVRTKYYIPVIEGQQYVLYTEPTASGATVNLSAQFYSKNDYATPRVADSGWLSNGSTITIPSGIKYIRCALRYIDNRVVTVSSFDNTQIELGSTATPYEPYQGKTYTLALGDTIYGGTVDFDSGVMTVNRVKTTVGELEWTKYDVVHGTLFRGALANIKQVADGYELTSAISSAYLAVPNNNRTDKTLSQGPGISAVDIIDDDYADAASFKTAMSDVEICYELATPTTIQLTPQQIQLLQGTNTLYASTGDISVTVNGVSGAIGSVQEQVNELAEDVAEIKPVDYSTTEQKTGQKWVDGKDIYIKTISLAETDFTKTNNWFWQKDIEPLITGYETIVKIFGAAIIEFDGSKHLLPFGSELYNVNNSDKCIKFANYYRNIIIKGTPYNDSDINFATKNLAIVKCNITVAYTKTT